MSQPPLDEASSFGQVITFLCTSICSISLATILSDFLDAHIKMYGSTFFLASLFFAFSISSVPIATAQRFGQSNEARTNFIYNQRLRQNQQLFPEISTNFHTRNFREQPSNLGYPPNFVTRERESYANVPTKNDRGNNIVPQNFQQGYEFSQVI
jgi:hypothetical protein